MKLRQNAHELILIEVDGLGLILGEIRYNRQTETVLFALEKAAFFDIYFPCAVVYEQQRGPVVHPHIFTALTTSSIRVQRSRVSCFVLETDINPELSRQYYGLLKALSLKQGHNFQREDPNNDHKPGGHRPSGGSRVIALHDRKERH